MARFSVIIPAAGKAERFGGQDNKTFAKLAGRPKSVVHRAYEVLSQLETDNRQVPAGHSAKSRRQPAEPETQQIPLFGQKSPIMEELKNLDVNSLTPLEAITRLYELQKEAREG